MTEIAFCNTKEGMHIKAKELNIPAYNLGCSCKECEVEFKDMLSDNDSVGIEAPKLIALEARDKVIWNEAIEAAANLIQHESDGMLHYEQIRSLKK